MSTHRLETWADEIRRHAIFRSPGLQTSWEKLIADMRTCSGFGEELRALALRFYKMATNGFGTSELENMAKLFANECKREIDLYDLRYMTEIERTLYERDVSK